MKKVFCILAIVATLPSLGQESTNNVKINVQPGYVLHFNDLNEDNYLNNKSPWGHDSGNKMSGISLNFMLPTRFDYLNLAFGAIIEKCWDAYSGTTTDYKLNGGGVYAGISPKLGGEHFGVTSLLAVGVFSYKEYFAYYSESPPPTIDIYEKKASFGLGAMSSIGLYARVGPIGLHPQVQAIFSGGSEASFLFYGFVIPLTIQF